MFSFSHAQNTFFRWIHNNEIADLFNKSYCIPLRDGGYLLASNYYQTGSYTGLLLIRLAADGATDWVKQIAIPDPDVNKFLVSVIQNSNGEFVFGNEYDLDSHIYDEEVNYIKTDSLGNVLKDMNLTYSGMSNWSFPTGNLVQTTDGNYIFTWFDFGMSDGFGIFAKINDSGSQLWGTNFGSYYRIYSSSLLKSGKILFTGGSIYNSYNAKVQILNTNGGSYDQALFHNPTSSPTSYNSISSSVELQDGFLFPVNYNDGTNNNLWLVRTNSLLDTIWTKNFIGYGPVLGIDTLPSGNVIIASIYTNTNSTRDVRFIVLDNSFNIAFTRNMGTPNDDNFFSFKKCLDGSFVLSAMPYDTSGLDLLAFKMDTNVCINPVANITIDSSAVFLPGEAGIAFNDNSLLCLTDTAQMSWFWDFGDGTTSTLVNPSHIFPAQGNYLVEMIVNNGCYNDTAFISVNAVCNGEPNHFELQDSLMTAQFSASALSATSWLWNFGDGTTSTLENPSHVYTNPGNYNVCLSYTNSCGPLTICDSVTVSCPPPALNLGQDIFDCLDNTYTLNAGSSGNLYLWSTGESTDTINITTSGTFWVQSTNICGTMSTDTINVSLSSYPVIDFGNDTLICLNSSDTFYNHSGSNGYAYQWYNNNVLSGSDTLYTKTFNALGNYEIQGIVSNNGCIDSSTIYVNVLTPLQCNPSLPYCLPAYTVGTTTGKYINGFGLNTISNLNSGSSSGPSYNDYYNIYQTTLTSGLSYLFTIEFAGASFFQYFGVWIDYNQDGVFDNSTEKIGSGSAGGTTILNRAIPTNIPNGETRLRIRSMNSSSSATVDPCDTFQYGEAEDYKVIIVHSCPAMVVNSTHTNESCLGNNGSISVTLSGGVMPAAYTWSNGETGSFIDSLTNGVYIVTATDYNGCTAISSINVASVSGVTSTFTNSSNQCITGNNFSFNNTGSSGVDYTYSWTFQGGTPASATTNNVSNVTWTIPGTYTITHSVTGTGSCTSAITSTTTSTIIVYPLPTAITTQTNVSCNGGSNGTATVSAGGGTSPYTYVWNDPAPVQTTATCTGLTAGIWTVTVTSASGCTTTSSVTITQPPVLTASISAQANVSCNGGSNGTATVLAGGGTSPYTYLWNDPAPAQTTATCTGLTPGNWWVVVTDAGGCTNVAITTITQPSALTTTIAGSNPTCYGYTNGSVNLTPSGGTVPYTYTWSNGATSQDLSGIAAGTYTVTVTDNLLCTKTASVTITSPSAVTATISSHTDLLCHDGTTGAATVAVGGGTGPYTYLWNDPAPAQTTATCTGLTVGTWTVTVTSATGCTATASIAITAPSALTATISSQTNVACNGGATGTATVTAGGGIAPYTYLWNDPAPAQVTSTCTALTAGTWSVTVRDAYSCSTTSSVTITQAPVLTASISAQTNVSCNGGANGTATVSAGGGTAPYTYLWNDPVPAQTTATCTGLTTGTWIVTVTGVGGCTSTASVTITQPPALTASITGTNPACNGSANGSANLTPSGGTPPYTYTWSNSATSEDISGIAAGIYSVTVTDNFLCSTTAGVTITNPSVLTATISSHTDLLCNGSATGLATVIAGGGTAPYTYLWNDPAPAQTTATCTGLTAGTWTVTVTGTGGCTATASVTITAPSALTATVSAQTNVLCNGGSTGSATVTAGGGTPGYTYQWDVNAGAQTTATVTSLSAGAYCCTVADLNMCTSVICVTIIQPSQLVAINATLTNVPCYGFCNGTVTVITLGGVSPYQYLWNNDSTGNSLTDLCGGVYYMTVTDANGCTVSNPVVISEPTQLTDFVSSTDDNGTGNGTASVIAGGGTLPYYLQWDDLLLQTTYTATGLSAGWYHVTITDENGCIKTDSVEVYLWSGLGYQMMNFNCSLHPNPVKGDFTLKISTNKAEDISVIIYNSIGDIIYRKDILLTGGDNLQNFDMRDITSGIYYIKLQGINNVSYLRFIKTE